MALTRKSRNTNTSTRSSVIKKNPHNLVVFIVIGLSIAMVTQGNAQTINVQNAPRQFTVVAPTSWVQQATSTGNSRIKFSAPPGAPTAECAVIVKDFPGLRGQSQSTFDQQMAETPDPREIAAQLSSIYNNVRIFSTGVVTISGFPAQLVNTQYSVGTPSGELWARGFSVTTATTPGLVWTISCGALGRNQEDALKSFSHWQLEMTKFLTNVKIR